MEIHRVIAMKDAIHSHLSQVSSGDAKRVAAKFSLHSRRNLLDILTSRLRVDERAQPQKIVDPKP